MPRRPSFKVSKTTKGRFLVHVPASLSMLGKLERRTFENAKEAEKFAAKLRTEYHAGRRGGIIEPNTAHQATAAEDALKRADLNVTVVEAVCAYIDARRILDKHGQSIESVVKSWSDARKARGDDRAFVEAATDFIKEKEMGWSDRYRRNIDQTMKALPDWFKAMKLPDISEAIMLKAVKESVSTETAIETRMRHVKSLSSGKGRRKRKRASAAILDGQQVETMLQSCETDAERRAVALLLFAGIRPDAQDGEISKLDWSAVGKKEIRVSADVSKTGSERIIPIRPRLAALITGHPKQGRVLPPNWAKRIQAIRKAAGMSLGYQDATRHTFASHHLVAYGEASTQAAMGHAEGSRTLFKHYRAAVSESAAKAYFRRVKP